MMKKYAFFIGILTVLSGYVIAGQFKKTPNGLQYAIYKPQKGERIKDGDIVFLNLSYRTNKDSLLFSSWQLGGPVSLKVEPSTFKGDLMEGLRLLTVNDSADFKINADSLFTKTFAAELPPFIEKGSLLTFTVKITRVTTEAKLQEEEKAAAVKQQAMEKEMLAKYVADKKLNPVITASGLQYVVNSVGTGPKPTAGQKVKVHYTGTLLDGTKFDSSVDRNEPFEFTLGRGQVIKGWDEGIALLNKGSKAVLILPSSLAYGTRGAGSLIPPNTPLIFEVELIDMQ
jgi:FKBP-type peptidyl-prolyl cis-trans isomerase FkpA